MSISFKQYITEFNHTHKFSNQFLNKIFDYAETIYSKDILMGNYSPAETVAHFITYVVNRFTHVLCINIPLLEFLANTSQSSPIVHDCISIFIVKCNNKKQLFVDKELLTKHLSSVQINGLCNVICSTILNGETEETYGYICEQLLQTDIGKQNIIDVYNSISENTNEIIQTVANIILPYAQKALVAGNITSDDIKELFDI